MSLPLAQLLLCVFSSKTIIIFIINNMINWTFTLLYWRIYFKNTTSYLLEKIANKWLSKSHATWNWFLLTRLTSAPFLLLMSLLGSFLLLSMCLHFSLGFKRKISTTSNTHSHTNLFESFFTFLRENKF